MSFRIGHFGTGFSLSTLSSAALRFISLVKTRGVDVTIIIRTKTATEDDYGQHTYTEITQSEHALVQREPKNLIIQPGNLLTEVTVFFMSLLAPVADIDEILLDADRYMVRAMERTDVYLKVQTERRIDN